MGTALQSAGLAPGGSPDIWGFEHPGIVESILRSYVDAGAELLETNTFGGSPARLDLHGAASRSEEINRAAAATARSVAGDRVLVLGSIGPTGLLLSPLGPLDEAQALDGFRRQAAALASGGADALIVETMTDPGEAAIAVRAAAETRLPVIACMTYEVTPRGIFTVFGATPERAAKALALAGASVVGTNCGTGPGTMMEMVRALRAATSLPILAQPNAGIPIVEDGVMRYPATPAGMASHVAAFVAAGASIIGGCCGTTAEHVRAMAAEVRAIRDTV
jgi:5-methyltetrahydrofolate--homocysteine methyltransferase